MSEKTQSSSPAARTIHPQGWLATSDRPEAHFRLKFEKISGDTGEAAFVPDPHQRILMEHIIAGVKNCILSYSSLHASLHHFSDQEQRDVMKASLADGIDIHGYSDIYTAGDFKEETVELDTRKTSSKFAQLKYEAKRLAASAKGSISN